MIPRAADANEGGGTGKETGVRQDGTEPEDRAEGNSENSAGAETCQRPGETWVAAAPASTHRPARPRRIGSDFEQILEHKARGECPVARVRNIRLQKKR